jgi:hypothetical protein
LLPDEAAPILARFYLSTSRQPGFCWLFFVRRCDQETGPDYIFSLRQIGILVNGTKDSVERDFTLMKLWRKLFNSKPDPLKGAPPVRRLKTYSADSGYVYQYFYEGCRGFGSGAGKGVEYVFSASSDRKRYGPVVVRLGNSAVEAWEQEHSRELSSSERFALVKLALFQAFDERPTPAEMRHEIHVRRADLDSIAETLDL